VLTFAEVVWSGRRRFAEWRSSQSKIISTNLLHFQKVPHFLVENHLADWHFGRITNGRDLSALLAK